jgi:hypothetical protein
VIDDVKVVVQVLRVVNIENSCNVGLGKGDKFEI